VEAVAAELGYRRMPLVSALFSSIRNARHSGYAGNLGFVFIKSAEVAVPLPFQVKLLEGAKAKARELGFKLELHGYDPAREPLARLQRVLLARGVVGLVIVHVQKQADFSALDWAQFTAVQFDTPLVYPELNTVGVDHHRSLFAVLRAMAARGYKRMGMFIELHKDERLRFRWSSAFLGYQHSRFAEAEEVPVLEVERLERGAFLRWFRRYRPDLLVGHHAKALEWLREDGFRVPEEVGYVALNQLEAGGDCAGLDLVPEEQGALAVEALVAQLLRFERGVPARPSSILIEARWREGGTVRPG
jgi:LacI family transcriptional regulator